MWDIILLIVFIVLIGVLIYFLVLLLQALVELARSFFSKRKVNKVADGRGTISGKKYNNQNHSNGAIKELTLYGR